MDRLAQWPALSERTPLSGVLKVRVDPLDSGSCPQCSRSHTRPFSRARVIGVDMETAPGVHADMAWSWGCMFLTAVSIRGWLLVSVGVQLSAAFSASPVPQFAIACPARDSKRFGSTMALYYHAPSMQPKTLAAVLVLATFPGHVQAPCIPRFFRGGIAANA